MGKTKAHKPTRTQKAVITGAGLTADNWLVLRDTPEEMRLVSRGSGRSRVIRKGGKAK